MGFSCLLDIISAMTRLVPNISNASGFGMKACLSIILDMNGASWHRIAGNHVLKVILTASPRINRAIEFRTMAILEK